jgi:hypothetical protein
VTPRTTVKRIIGQLDAFLNDWCDRVDAYLAERRGLVVAECTACRQGAGNDCPHFTAR